MSLKFAFAALAVALSTGSAIAAPVFSDDFEANGLGLNVTPIGWTVNPGTVDVIGTGFYEWYGEGRYIDLNGSTSEAGTMSQLIATLTAGVTYALSFDVGFNRGSGSNEAIGFSIADLNGSYGPPIVLDNDGFRTLVYRFTATATAHLLTFADIGGSPGDNGGPVLDNVSISQVPVPAAGVLLLLGLGALGVAGRRKHA